MNKKEPDDNGRSVSIQTAVARPSFWYLLNAFRPTVGDHQKTMRLICSAASQGFNSVCLSGEKEIRPQHETQELYSEAAENGLVLFEQCSFDPSGYSLRTDADIDYFVMDKVVPHIQRKRDDAGSTLNLYLTDMEDLLQPHRGWETGHVCYKISQKIIPICESENGPKPEIIIATSKPELYQPILQAFPKDVQYRLHHTTSTLPAIFDDTPHIYGMLEHIARDDDHGVYKQHRRDRDLLGINQMGSFGSYDIPYGYGEGYSLPDRLCLNVYDPDAYIETRKIIIAQSLLGTRSHTIQHGDHRNHFHRQPNPVTAKPIDLSEYDLDGDCWRFMANLNMLKKSAYALHDSYDRMEMAYSFGGKDVLFRMWPKPKFQARPVDILLDTRKAGQEGQEDPVRIISKLTNANKTKPEALLLLGPHQGLNRGSMAKKYGLTLLNHNGEELFRPEGQQVPYKSAPNRDQNQPKAA